MHFAKRIQIQPYDLPLEIWLNDSTEDVNRRILKRGGHREQTLEEPEPFAVSIESGEFTSLPDRRRVCYYIILNPAHPLDRITPGVVAHECQHIVRYVFQWINHRTPETDHADEPGCHLLNYLVDETTKVLIQAGFTLQHDLKKGVYWTKPAE